MKLLSASEFAAREASPYTDTQLASSELLLDGQSTSVVVTGEIMHAAVAWRGYRIAFFTDDIIFEESLRIYMFDTNMRQVDAATLGAMYSTGTFSDLRLLPPDTLTFHFFGGTVWRLTLLAAPEFAVPFFSDPRGVSRKFRFQRHFRIDGNPQPDDGINTQK